MTRSLGVYDFSLAAWLIFALTLTVEIVYYVCLTIFVNFLKFTECIIATQFDLKVRTVITLGGLCSQKQQKEWMVEGWTVFFFQRLHLFSSSRNFLKAPNLRGAGCIVFCSLSDNKSLSQHRFIMWWENTGCPWMDRLGTNRDLYIGVWSLKMPLFLTTGISPYSFSLSSYGTYWSQMLHPISQIYLYGMMSEYGPKRVLQSYYYRLACEVPCVWMLKKSQDGGWEHMRDEHPLFICITHTCHTCKKGMESQLHNCD